MSFVAIDQATWKGCSRVSIGVSRRCCSLTLIVSLCFVIWVLMVRTSLILKKWLRNELVYAIRMRDQSLRSILTSWWMTNMASFLICLLDIWPLSRVELRRIECVRVFVDVDWDRFVFWLPARARLSCSVRNAAILDFISGSSQMSKTNI